ncbi:Pet127-domain-containing protein [Xylaria intraflava]|nr:Pet127-domain-containing protein [Xylaria intraflava]
MINLWCCLARRKDASRSSDGVTDRHPDLPVNPISTWASSGDSKALTDLRQKREMNTLSTAEARALLNASDKGNAPLTPREIEDLHRILSPQPDYDKPGTSSSLSERSRRTPTNQMLPDIQNQSDLFCLPAEIRAQIWRLAMGRQKIYLAVKEGRLVQQGNMQRPYWRQARGLLSVPLVCRKSYLESINLLYSEHTFGFGFGPVGSSKDFFTQPDTLLLPQCIAAMTSLEVGFHLSGGYSQYYDSHPQAWDLSLQIAAPEPLGNWNAVFKALSQMKQLRSLVVVVWASGDRRYEFVTRESELMDIPTRMTGLKRFEVWLPWDEDEEELTEGDDKKSTPYIVRRNFEDRERFGVSVPDWRGPTIFAMLQLSRRNVCRVTSSYVCASCLATSHPPSIVARRPIITSQHVRRLSTTIASRGPATHEAPAATSNVEPPPPPSKPKKAGAVKKARAPKAREPKPSDTEHQLKILQGALTALKNVLSTQGVDVSQILGTTSPPATKDAAPAETKRKSKAKAESVSEPAKMTRRSRKSESKSEDKAEDKSEDATTVDDSSKPVGIRWTKSTTKSRAAKSRTAKSKPATSKAETSAEQPEDASGEETPAIKVDDLATPFDEMGTPFQPKSRSSSSKDSKPRKRPVRISGHGLSLVPIPTDQPAVPPLSYELDRVLFNPGVYQIQDPRSRIMPVKEFDFNALKAYVTSSKDQTLITIAKEHQKKYTGSTSSMTSMLAHFHYLLSAWRDINISMLTKRFVPESLRFTRIMKAPAAIFLHWKDGTYAIDADKEFDTANILSMLGKSMEKLLTLSKDDYERYRHGNSDQITEEERNASEAYHYTGFQDFMMRSQLDAHDPRMPGTGMFDLKTRAVISIRMDAKGYEKGLGYEIRGRHGQWESFEREYYDMIRSAFLKYSLQVRMGRMDGIFVAFHNTQRIFGFQYIPLSEMDMALHGTSNLELGDQEFMLSLNLLNEILNRATQKWPKQSLRIHFETRESTGAPFMYIFAKPTTPEEIAAVQDASKKSVEAFEKNILGLVKRADEGGEEPLTVAEDVAQEDVDDATLSPAQEMDSSAIWQEARQMVEKAIGDDELGVGLQSGILRARSLVESREYVDALINALTGRIPSTQIDVSTEEPDGEETIESESEENSTQGMSSQSESAPETLPVQTKGADIEEGSEIIDEDAAIDENEPSSTPTQQSADEKTAEILSSKANDADEEFDEDDDYEEASEAAELESDIEKKESGEGAGSSNLEPLKSLIIRMARGIGEGERSGVDIDEFERILGRLISQSRIEQPGRENGDKKVDQDASPESESITSDGISAGESKPNEGVSTDAKGEEVPQPNAAGESPPTQAQKTADVLGLTLTIKNKLNGNYKWSVEYEIQELEKKSARRLYDQLKQRRKKVFSDDRDKDAEWYRMFAGNLATYTQKGRSYREEESKREKSAPLHMVGSDGPLQWADVFPGSKNIEASSGDQK